MLYDIISALSNTYAKAQLQVVAKVNEKLQEGWIPCGGVSIARDPNIGRCYASQAIMKEEDNSAGK